MTNTVTSGTTRTLKLSGESTDESADPFNALSCYITQLEEAGLFREYVPCSYDSQKPGSATYDGTIIEVWCSNDYLGMNYHPLVIQAMVAASVRHGTGNGGSRAIAGTSIAHVELENAVARWHSKEAGLVFNSGYVANTEALRALGDRLDNAYFLSDVLNHRSIIEGVRASGKPKSIFRHNDPDHLGDLLAGLPDGATPIVAFESVYSMDGDISPVVELLDVAKHFGAITYIDETHAIGVLGRSGGGVCELLGETRADFVQGVFGKALGSTGGYIAGKRVALESIRSSAPGFIFTTTIPRANLEATLESIRVVQNSPELRQQLFSNVAHLKDRLSAAQIEYLPGNSHLVPVLVRGAQRSKRIARTLLNRWKIYVQPINFPSVPLGEERFRITTPPYRTHSEIDRFVEALRYELAQDP